METKAFCAVGTGELEYQVDEANSELAAVEIDLVRATSESPLAPLPGTHSCQWCNGRNAFQVVCEAAYRFMFCLYV